MSLGPHASRHRDAAAQPLADALQTRERAAVCYSTGCLVAVAPISSRRAEFVFLAASERNLNGQTRKGRNDMRTTWCVILIAASAMIGTIDVLHAQPEENPGRNEFLRSCASCHGVSGKGDGPVAKSLSPPPSDLTRLSEANNDVFPVSRVHEVIDGRIESLIHGTRDMPVWGDRYMQEMISRESRDFVSKEWNEAIVRRRILALVEYISTLQRATRRSR
jgi:mono/diheme cytochrome c family protein